MLLMICFVRSLGSFQASLEVAEVCSQRDHGGSIALIRDHIALAFYSMDL